jgi:membrane-associated phospholipid phosphatase
MLIFWDNRFLRWLFLGLSIFFGASVLLAHVHYSIDVFAAPFIVYGMFVITKNLFPHDYAMISPAAAAEVSSKTLA